MRGYATAAFSFNDVAPDRADGFEEGLRAVFSKQPLAADAWGALSAWGWGASRVLDYLETDQAIDARHVAVIGHSRAGKAALWCGAEDERFAMAFPTTPVVPERRSPVARKERASRTSPSGFPTGSARTIGSMRTTRTSCR